MPNDAAIFQFLREYVTRDAGTYTVDSMSEVSARWIAQQIDETTSGDRKSDPRAFVEMAKQKLANAIQRRIVAFADGFLYPSEWRG